MLHIMQITQRETCFISRSDLLRRLQRGEDGGRQTKAIKHGYMHVHKRNHPQNILREYACVLPSCRSRWPGIIHPALRTPSLPSPWWQKKKKQQKASREEENLAKYPSVQTAPSIRYGDLRLFIRPFLSSDPSQQRRQQRRCPQSAACGVHRQKKKKERKENQNDPVLLRWHREPPLASLRCRYSPLGRTGGMEQGRASAGELEGHMRRGPS